MGGAPVMQATPAAPQPNAAEVERARRDELFGNRKAAGRQATQLTKYTDMLTQPALLKATTGGQ